MLSYMQGNVLVLLVKLDNRMELNLKIISVEVSRKGKMFVIESASEGRVCVKESLGAKCLYHLINNEGRSFNPVFFRSIIENDVEIPAEIQNNMNFVDKDDQLIYQSLSIYIPATDIMAVREIKQRMGKIENELLKAEENHDLRKKDELISEKEQCENYLQETINKNGTFKNLNTINRKSIKSISRAIDVVLKEISDQSEVLYKILKKNIVKNSNQIKFVGWGDEPLIS